MMKTTMQIAIIGAGKMARGIGTRVVKGGHSLTIYHKQLKDAESLANDLGENVKGNQLGAEVSEEIVILALPYSAIPELLQEQSERLEGKILVDISNPVNFETFELIPPTTSSGAQEIAKSLPKNSRLVKAFNTIFSRTLLEEEVDGKKLDVFVASDDKDAAAEIVKIANDGGLRGLYVGSLKRARALEEMQLIQMQLQEDLGTNWMSALKIIP